MGAIASQITSLTIVYSAVCSGADERKHQSSASLAFVRGIHRWPVNSPHKWPVTQKVFPFDDVIVTLYYEQGCVTWQTCNDTIKHDDCILTPKLHYSDVMISMMTSQNYQRFECLLDRLFRRRSKKSSKLRVTGHCEENPPVTVGSPQKDQ